MKKVFPNQIEHTHKHPHSSLIWYATENEHESYKPLFNPPHETQEKKNENKIKYYLMTVIVNEFYLNKREWNVFE